VVDRKGGERDKEKFATGSLLKGNPWGKIKRKEKEPKKDKSPKFGGTLEKEFLGGGPK